MDDRSLLSAAVVERAVVVEMLVFVFNSEGRRLRL
jgi:hypothetical protein